MKLIAAMSSLHSYMTVGVFEALKSVRGLLLKRAVSSTTSA